MQQLMMDHNLFEEIIHEKDGPCVTLQIPTQRVSSARKHNDLLLRTIMKEGIDQIDDVIAHIKQIAAPENVKQYFQEEIATIYKRINSQYALDGLGIFVSPKIAAFVYFPFPVSKRVVVGSQFAYRDVLYLKQYTEPYKVVLLSKKVIRLFSAVGNLFSEVINTDFPFVYHDEYEYAKPSLGNSYGYSIKTFEKDKSVMQTKRIGAFIQNSEELLHKYISGTGQKIIIAGTERMLSEFERSSNLQPYVIGKVAGSFNDENLHSLADQAWYTLKDYKDLFVNQLIDALSEERNRNLVAFGIENVSEAAKEGKGLILYVERDFFENEKKNEYQPSIDRVDTIISTVLEKNGNVIFTEKDALRRYDRIAMRLRF